MYDKFVATLFFHLQNCAKIKNVQNTPERRRCFGRRCPKSKMSAPLLDLAERWEISGVQIAACESNEYGAFIINGDDKRVNKKVVDVAQKQPV